jgi:hypothetical protein
VREGGEGIDSKKEPAMLSTEPMLWRRDRGGLAKAG